MVYLDTKGYVIHSKYARSSHRGGNLRNWFLVKYLDNSNKGVISLNGKRITMPAKLIGKRIRIKVEEVKDEDNISRR